MKNVTGKLVQRIRASVMGDQIVDLVFELINLRPQLHGKQVTKRLDEIERVVKKHPYYGGQR